MIETLIKQIEKVIALLEQRLMDDPDRPVLKTLYDRYVKSKEILTNNYDINKIMIIGGCRAYLDSFSDYMNPLLIEMDNAEKIFRDMKNKNIHCSTDRFEDLTVEPRRILYDSLVNEAHNVWMSSNYDEKKEKIKQELLKQSKKLHPEPSLNNRRKILGYKNILARRVTRVLIKQAARRREIKRDTR